MLNIRDTKESVVLAPYTTYKIGGKADYFISVSNKRELVTTIKKAKQENTPFFVLGTGANILIGDGGFRGLVIHNKSKNFHFNGNLLVAESGATIEDLINASVEQGLSGSEHFAGIPSSVGGAIKQNLHFLSPDRQSTIFIETIVKEATVLERDTIKRVDKSYFKFGYDDSILHHNKEIFVLDVTFELEKRDAELIRGQVKANLDWRNEKQPQLRQFPSCGSVFKKIEGVGAGRLIEKCGLKGKKIGEAMVSEKHANYLVNTGNATASDMQALISLIQGTVLKETGFKLEPEIGFVGEF